MKKIVALALSVVMVLACFCVFAVADDEAVKIPVYKINPEYYYEGCVAIYTHERGDVLGQENQNFAYWTIRVFDYDEATGGYKCIVSDAEMGKDKTNTEIPENGFVLGANGGNNWPHIFSEATGSEWYYNDSNDEGIPYKDCPNYNTEHVIAALALIANINVGDIYYLDGISLDNADLNTNEDGETIFYYSDNFVSNAFLSSVKPDETVVDEPSKEDPTPVTTTKNVAAGKSYVVEGASDSSYLDNGSKLTDGVLPESASYSDPAIVGLVSSSAFYTENGFSQVTIDLGAETKLTGFATYISNLKDAGVAAASSIIYEYSVDGTNFTEIGEGSYDVDIATEAGVTAKNTIDADVSARYVRVKFVAGEGVWMMVSEIEAYTTVSGGKPTEPTSDSGIIALAVVASLAAAGAVIIKKSR